MPTKYKIILTILVLIASILVACFEYVSANILYVWIIIVVTFLMISPPISNTVFYVRPGI